MTFSHCLTYPSTILLKLGTLSVLLLALGINLTGCHKPPVALSSQSMTGSDLDKNLDKNAPNAQSDNAKVTATELNNSRHIKVTSDIVYGQDARQRLDIYSLDDNQRHPVLIFVYGGSWERGKRQTYAFVGRQFAKAGYTTVVVDYRLAPKHVFPDYVLDTAHAMGWVHRHIAQYGGNSEQLFVMGHSAGAFNVVSAVDDNRFWSQSGIPDNAVLGIIGLAGPYDYDFRLGKTQTAFPKNSTPYQVMPVYHIRQGIPPHLLVTGSKDTVVYPQNADSLQNALIKAGGQVERIQVPASHAGIVLGLSKPLQPFYPTFDKIKAYMQHQLAQQPK